MDNSATIENERISRLGQARKEAQLAKDVAKAAVGGPGAKAKLVLSFGKKVSEHWLIVATAVLFDLFALIPFLGTVFNFLFGLVLYIYFGSKSKGGSEFTKIFLPVAGGSVIDWFFLNFFPANIAAALIRIALN